MHSENIDSATLEEIETCSVIFAREAGNILLEQFDKPLEIKFKGKNNTDPVTTADRLSEDYLKKAIGEKFPGHNILSEEVGAASQSDSPFTWVLDPLDGTANFINNLPFFAVSIGVLWKNRPVAGSIYVPVSHRPAGGVYHGCLGKGAFFNDEKITSATESRVHPLSEIPPSFGGRFRLSGKSRKETYETRNLGSIALELALAASGVFQFALFNSPKIWDVAAGILLVREAGGVVYTCRGKGKNWIDFDEFRSDKESDEVELEFLQRWSSPLIAGTPDTVNQVIKDIRIRRNPLSWMRALRARSKR